MSIIFHRAWNFGYPVSVSIEPANICNLKCPECSVGRRELTRDNGMMSFELFKNIIDNLYKKTSYLTLYFQGEPYLHNGLFEMIKYAGSRKMYVATSTNAHFLDNENAEKTVKSGLSKIIISIDGTTQEVYGKYRVGGSLEKVIEGTRNLINCRKKLKSFTPEIVFQFLITRYNEHQLNEIKKLAVESGVDRLLIKTAQLYQYENGNEFIPENEEYSRYRKTRDGNYVLKNNLRNHCKRLWTSCVFTQDGFILPCCFDKDACYPMGNLENQSIKGIWNGKKMKSFRSNILKNRKGIDICCNCIEGTGIWI